MSGDMEQKQEIRQYFLSTKYDSLSVEDQTGQGEAECPEI